ncbi:hypothetical protein ZWY2020_026149 [Hordeum vulgare]|nr:hypothetical protein ZWY2020_026149 [Hordeum vulgare]
MVAAAYDWSVLASREEGDEDEDEDSKQPEATSPSPSDLVCESVLAGYSEQQVADSIDGFVPPSDPAWDGLGDHDDDKLEVLRRVVHRRTSSSAVRPWKGLVPKVEADIQPKSNDGDVHMTYGDECDRDQGDANKDKYSDKSNESINPASSSANDKTLFSGAAPSSSTSPMATLRFGSFEVIHDICHLEGKEGVIKELQFEVPHSVYVCDSDTRTCILSCHEDVASPKRQLTVASSATLHTPQRSREEAASHPASSIAPQRSREAANYPASTLDIPPQQMEEAGNSVSAKLVSSANLEQCRSILRRSGCIRSQDNGNEAPVSSPEENEPMVQI